MAVVAVDTLATAVIILLPVHVPHAGATHFNHASGTTCKVPLGNVVDSKSRGCRKKRELATWRVLLYLGMLSPTIEWMRFVWLLILRENKCDNDARISRRT